MSDLDAPVEASDPEVLLVAAYEAMRVLGREVRALRAELAGEAS